MAKALETPMGPIAEMARQNMEMWARMQASMLSAFTPPGGASAPEKSDQPDKDRPDKPTRAERSDASKRRG
jgi:hypothetical protein